MPEKNKNNATLLYPDTAVIAKRLLSSKEYIFPEKLKKAKEILKKAKFRPI